MRLRKPNMRPIPEALARDYQVLDGRALWRSSKNREYRNSITEKLRCIHQFLKAKSMYASEEVTFVSPENFEIRRDHLTDEGFSFLWRYLAGYLEHLERTGRLTNPEYLSACFDHFESAH